MVIINRTGMLMIVSTSTYGCCFSIHHTETPHLWLMFGDGKLGVADSTWPCEIL